MAGAVRPGWARQGGAWKVRTGRRVQGMARRGLGWRDGSLAWPGLAGRAQSGLGSARRGQAGCGKARQAWWAGLGPDRLGRARPNTAGGVGHELGVTLARQDEAWRDSVMVRQARLVRVWFGRTGWGEAGVVGTAELDTVGFGEAGHDEAGEAWQGVARVRHGRVGMGLVRQGRRGWVRQDEASSGGALAWRDKAGVVTGGWV
jgi:hypothetical protein